MTRDFDIEWWVDDAAKNLVISLTAPSGQVYTATLNLKAESKRRPDNPWPARAAQPEPVESATLDGSMEAAAAAPKEA